MCRRRGTLSRVALPLVAVVTPQAYAFQVSLITAATWLPWLLVGLPAGAWVDRLPRRPLMVTCDAVSAAVLISVPLAAWAGLLTLAHLLAVALLTGARSPATRRSWSSFPSARSAGAPAPSAR